jgi:hypothetical protein
MIVTLRALVLRAVASLGPMAASAAEVPASQMTPVHDISIVPRWFDPDVGATASGSDHRIGLHEDSPASPSRLALTAW